MMRRLLRPAAFAIIFMGLDGVWLSQAGPRLYTPLLGDLLAAKPRLLAAAAFYAVYLFAAYRFGPGDAPNAPLRAAWRGGLFGFAAYATYDLTNEATLKVWPLQLTLIDLLWGTCLTAFASYLAVSVARRADQSAASETAS